MSTPQDPPVRLKQKRRRTKKLAEWRAKQAAAAPKTEAKKAPAKPADEKKKKAAK